MLRTEETFLKSKIDWEIPNICQLFLRHFAHGKNLEINILYRME